MKMLWISRHALNQEQLADLKRVYGTEPEITVWDKTVGNVGELRDAVRKSDVVGAVLPLDMVAAFLRFYPGKPLIRSVSERVPTGRMISDGMGEVSEYVFRHVCWEQVLRLDMEVRKL